ncbi:MAG TPA: hypothetical protein VIY72_04770 [Acidimicrobiales bacterium]
MKVPRGAQGHALRRGVERPTAPFMWLAAVCLLALGLASCSASSAGGAIQTRGGEPGRPVVVRLFGDSLTWESQAVLEARLGAGFDLRVTTFGGIAPCDLADEIIATAEADEADVLLLQMSGNAVSPCMHPSNRPLSDTERLDKYRADVLSIIEETSSTGIPLVLVGTPPMPPQRNQSPDAVYRELAELSASRDRPVSYLDAGAAVAGPAGAWTATLPCLPFESDRMGCTGGQIAVRAADQVHFCPGSLGESNGTIVACDRWSSGAWRYGAAIAADLRDRYPPG